MWEIEYTDEVKFYFLDNYPYTFALLIRIEELKFAPDAIPPEGATPLADEPNTYQWEVLDHMIYYEKVPGLKPLLLIWLVKPIE